jgi:hypothetical protein
MEEARISRQLQIFPVEEKRDGCSLPRVDGRVIRLRERTSQKQTKTVSVDLRRQTIKRGERHAFIAT